MAKATPDAILDKPWDYVKANGTRLCVCTSEPTTYTEAITTYKLAIKTITTTDFTGPADGDTSGRKLTVNAANGLTVDTTGTALHIAIADSGGSALLYVTTCTSQALTAGNTVNVPAWAMEFRDPA